jgi:hypothetical protein
LFAHVFFAKQPLTFARRALDDCRQHIDGLGFASGAVRSIVAGINDGHKGLYMFKYALLISLVLPACASAADYIEHSSNRSHANCPSDQGGNRYCIDTPPVEKRITDCDPGVDCHHMQSGHHYSVQSPVNLFD